MKFHLTFIFLLFTTFLFAQNLFLNPSFEDYSLCPDNQCQIYRATGWQSYGYTPDYYNICGTPNWSVPQNVAGYQYAATGNAYAGIFTYCSSCYNNNSREYIGVQLINPMALNQKYYVSFKANFTKYININCATNKLGVLFSTVSYALDTSCNIITLLLPQNHAHIYENSIITDTANWTLVSGSFVADSAYKYIIIGNFFDNAHTDSIKYDNNPCISYYYIDDIYVGENPEAINENSLINKINIFPNPATNELTIDFALTDKSFFELYDVIGAKRKAVTLDIGSQTKNIDLTDIDNGLYFYSVVDRNGSIIKTGKLIVIK